MNKEDDYTYMVDDNEFSSTEKLLRDDNAAQRIGSSTTRIANDMGISFLEAQSTGRVFVY